MYFHVMTLMTCQTDTVEIPISAALPKSRICFDGVCDLGRVVKDSSAFGSIKLENEGERPGKFEFIWAPSLPIKIVPQSGTLGQAGGKADIKVEFFGGDVCMCIDRLIRNGWCQGYVVLQIKLCSVIVL